MRIKETIAAATIACAASAVLLIPRESMAQAAQGQPPVPPIVARDSTMGTVSNITMVAGATIVFLMPRVYYNDPEATVGWKARWHVSMLAPAMTLTALTLFVDTPIKGAIKSTRPGCNPEQTQIPGTECTSYGGPSTQAFASWSSTGFGTGLFIVDTVKYNDGRFSVGSFIGNVGLPLTLSIVTSLGRSLNTGGTQISPTATVVPSQPYESVGQNLLGGALPGFFTGAIIGVGYALLQRPNCGYGNNIICW
jgi:hypothetical protein